jgi:hypothetical protein
MISRQRSQRRVKRWNGLGVSSARQMRCRRSAKSVAVAWPSWGNYRGLGSFRCSRSTSAHRVTMLSPCCPRLPAGGTLVMTDAPEGVALRPAVVAGQVQADDYEATWRGLCIRRILKQADSPHWWWSFNVYGQPPIANDRGLAIKGLPASLQARMDQDQAFAHR